MISIAARFHFKVVLALLLFLSLPGVAQPLSQVREIRKKKEIGWLKTFSEFLSIPNIASDSNNIRKNAAFIQEMMIRRQLTNVQLLESKEPGVPPVVYGEYLVPGASKTLIFYAHYDGQPVNPAQWATGLHPFVPALYSDAIFNKGQAITLPDSNGHTQPEWRIYGRGASDDKAGVAGLLYALEALQTARIRPSANIKFFFEGEEEAGSPHLEGILKQNRELLKADGWIICDGPVHQSGRKMIALGVRGDAHLEITVYGPVRPLHSGHYGNWVPNPAMTLSKLLAGMKDDRGRVSIRGFYDDVQPLTTAEKKALLAVPSADEQMKHELGFEEAETPGQSLMEAINQPSLNINGMASGNTGKLSANVIPTTAIANIDLRLVLGNDWQRQQQKVIDHIRSKGFMVIDYDPTATDRQSGKKLVKVTRGLDGYNAQRTDLSLPLVQKVKQAVQSTSKEPIVLLPTLGGSLPLYVFEKQLGAKTLIVPIANHDNNQHAENENIRLENFWNGIETYAAIMTIDW
ncbi:M20/M25/M40 family metallo-hydrolase [Flavihumibacter petaseus]|uniref:Putative M20 family peptidase n=1 Tax=Flavihumibacter petaseus NBRC 106054 TaxID=1220578 RepID=A0A0E9N4I4_9BACT|nr:M20/M25/M40 family metallo-hydrolase [Flavihumibacter petaseus]GAO44581.1 putative M20 family peptidase [Flavihumibacter petaseus NBRC 106054]